MAIAFSNLFAVTQLTASAATFLTVPATPPATILSGGRVRFNNVDTVTQAVTAYAIPSGGSAATANCFILAYGIAPNTYIDVDLPILPAGGFYQALGGTTLKINVSPLAGVFLS